VSQTPKAAEAYVLPRLLLHQVLLDLRAASLERFPGSRSSSPLAAPGRLAMGLGVVQGAGPDGCDREGLLEGCGVSDAQPDRLLPAPVTDLGKVEVHLDARRPRFPVGRNEPRCPDVDAASVITG
jgi:hypothetical protein